MPGLLFEKSFPGATTCVLVGDAMSVVPARLKHFQRLLWLTDPESVRRARPLLPTSAIQTAIVGAAPAEPIVEQFLRHDPRHLPSVFVSDAVLTHNAAAYRQVISEVQAILDSHHRSRVTRQKDGFIWQKHVLGNLTDYAARRVPSTWAGALKGLPAFICGAGPSLDVSAPKLAPLAAHGVVFAADSALRALARHGVQADFAVSVDAAKVPDKCLPPDRLPARIILSAVSPPAWQTAAPGSARHYLSSSQITVDWLAIQGIPRTPLAVTENCGATAVELARFLGCAPIYLFGLDLAVDSADPRKRHNAAAEPSIYQNSGYDAAQAMPQVPGNYAANVPTFAYGDWQALDARLAGWPADLVFNVTDRGARFRNTTLVAPADFRLAPAVSRCARPIRLADAPSVETPTLNAALHRVRLAGQLGTTKAAHLAKLLAMRGPEPLAIELRQLFADQTLARVLGAFSLKVMPHLVPPIEGDPALWSDLLRELTELSHLAAEIKT